MDGLSAGVSPFTGNGKTGDLSLPLIGVTVWEFFRELATIAVETVVNHVGNRRNSNFQIDDDLVKCVTSYDHIGLCDIKLFYVKVVIIYINFLRRQDVDC